MSLKLDRNTVLIGENNTGKSTILAALEYCLNQNLSKKGERVFSEYDYHLPRKDSQPTDSDGIEITLYFRERVKNEWPNETTQMLEDVIWSTDGGKRSITLCVHSHYDDNVDDFVTSWDFLDTDGNALTVDKNYLFELQQLVPVFYLSALRDSAREFSPHGKFWSPFVRAMKISPDLGKSLEKNLAELNQEVLKANKSIGVVKEGLNNIGKTVPLSANDAVSIEAIPSRIFDILSRTQVMLSSVTGARLPIGRHGEGTQSLSVIHLFDAFLRSQLTESYNKYISPIIVLEEPEAHLHPSATHLVANLLRNMPGQKIVTTHSGDLVGAFPIHNIYRLHRKGGEITAHHIQEGIFDKDDVRKINYHIRTSRGSVLFARCWLLVEGRIDRLVFERCAEVLGHDMSYEGISCIAYQEVGIKAGILVKLANDMGIEWHVVADRDQAGHKYVASVKKQVGDKEGHRITQWADGNLEVFLCNGGYGHIYEATISPQKKSEITAQKGDPDYWNQVVKAQYKRSKIENLEKVIETIEGYGSKGVPQQIRDIIMSTLNMAKEAKDG